MLLPDMGNSNSGLKLFSVGFGVELQLMYYCKLRFNSCWLGNLRVLVIHENTTNTQHFKIAYKSLLRTPTSRRVIYINAHEHPLSTRNKRKRSSLNTKKWPFSTLTPRIPLIFHTNTHRGWGYFETLTQITLFCPIIPFENITSRRKI